MNTIYRALTSRASSCAWLALGLVGARLLFFDHVFFERQAIPSHDMSQGLAFFATSMHSVRLTGEIAWWNPVGHNGYAQYFQSFLSPLAPTQHHVVFILWAQWIRALSWLGVSIPEYYQYLIVNYAILPWLAYWAFGLFARQLFRRRVTVVFLSSAYAFSGIGLWHTAWFYFQEPFSLFLLLAACVQVLRRPSAGNGLFLLAAALIQATSVNYWTLYDLFFAGIVLGSYAVIYPTRIRRLGRRTRQIVLGQRWISLATGTAVLATLVIWGMLVGSIVAEQSANYVRPYGEFSSQEVGRRAVEIRRYSTELFEPYVQRALDQYPHQASVHNARYLGAVLLPLLVLAACRRWRRRERWLFLVALGVLIVCLAPPFLLEMVRWVPGLDKIRHLCYFYTHYWQIALLLLAGTTLDDLLLGRFGLVCRRRGVMATVSLGCMAGTALIVLGFLSHGFPLNDINLQSGLLVSGLTLGAAIAILQVLWHDSVATRRIVASVLFLLQATDLSRYFVDVSAIDREFTRQRFQLPPALPSGTQWALRHPWRRPDLAKGFDGGLPGYMPFGNDLWPSNNFMLPGHLLELQQVGVPWNSARSGPAVSFHRRVEFAEDVKALQQCVTLNRQRLAETLIVQCEDRGEERMALRAMPRADQVSVDGEATFHFQFSRWQYNEFTFEVDVPENGWLYVRQLHDPLWHWTLDGEPIRAVRANCIGTALPARSGHHVIEMSYRPLARRLYWPACVLLESVLGLLLFARFIACRRESGKLGKRGKESFILLQRVAVHSGCSRIGLPAKLSRT